MTAIDAIERDIAAGGVAFLPTAQMEHILHQAAPLSDSARCAGSWSDLALDTYMKDGGSGPPT